MKFAYLIMGNFDPKVDRGQLKNGNVQIIGVKNLAEALTVAKELQEAGVQCIELCGAFEKAGAEAVIAATAGKVAVGYVVHTKAQDPLYDQLFPN